MKFHSDPEYAIAVVFFSVGLVLTAVGSYQLGGLAGLFLGAGASLVFVLGMK